MVANMNPLTVTGIVTKSCRPQMPFKTSPTCICHELAGVTIESRAIWCPSTFYAMKRRPLLTVPSSITTIVIFILRVQYVFPSPSSPTCPRRQEPQLFSIVTSEHGSRLTAVQLAELVQSVTKRKQRGG